MNQPAKAQEPSMEEILASIRRIIADDDAHKTQSYASEPPSSPPQAVPMQAMPMQAAIAPAAVHTAPTKAQEEIDAMLQELDAPVEHSPREEQPQDVLQLTESMATNTPSPFRTIDAQPDVFFSDDEPAPVREEPRAFVEPAESPLMSASASAAVDQAFNALAHTVLVQNARTLEDLVREMMRPMLKAWLDDNLPGLVERMVRAEIERVSRGRAG